MFIKPKPFQGPPGSTTAYEVRYPKGRKPFATLPEAQAFAKGERSTEGGWAEISQVIKIVVEKKS